MFTRNLILYQSLWFFRKGSPEIKESLKGDLRMKISRDPICLSIRSVISNGWSSVRDENRGFYSFPWLIQKI